MELSKPAQVIRKVCLPQQWKGSEGFPIWRQEGEAAR